MTKFVLFARFTCLAPVEKASLPRSGSRLVSARPADKLLGNMEPRAATGCTCEFGSTLPAAVDKADNRSYASAGAPSSSVAAVVSSLPCCVLLSEARAVSGEARIL